MMTLKIHLAADWLPELSPQEFEELRDDIQKRGLREPILVKDGHVIDGRHRLRACNELDIEPQIVEYEGSDCVDEIFSRNLFRRHLTADQRAMLVAKLRGGSLRKEAQSRIDQGRHRMALSDSTKPIHAHVEIAKEARVSQHKARAALHVLNNHKPLVADVIAGKRKLLSVKKRKPRATKAQIDKTDPKFVIKRLAHFFDYWPVTQHRLIKKICREFLNG